MALETGTAAAGETAIPHEHGLSSFVCACFTLNYLIGTGFLTLPWAFERSGLVLSTLGMMFICFVANLASDYVLSAMARAEALTVYIDSLKVKIGPDLSTGKVDDRRNQSIDESTALLQSSGFSERVDASEVNITIFQSLSTHDKLSNVGFPQSNRKLLIGERKFDLTELCQLFFGRRGLQAYGIAVVLDIYGFLWAYSSVFAAAMANTFPIMGPGVDCYPVYIVIFAIIVVPMSFLELSEQAIIQVFLSGCRIAMILLMVLTPIAATTFGSSDNIEDSSHSIPHFGEQMEPVGAPWFNFSNVDEMIPVIVFAVLFHQAIPGPYRSIFSVAYA
jgi:amino acid permease